MNRVAFWSGTLLVIAAAASQLLRHQPVAFLIDVRLVGTVLMALGLLLCLAALRRRRSILRWIVVAGVGALTTMFVWSSWLAVVEEDVQFASGELTMSGTLYRPRGEGPHPAVVLLHGSAPAFSTRDPYRAFADFFARRGVAALVYDKRSFGDSGGKLPFGYDELARDAEAAFRFLQRRDDIDGRRIGLWGISEGGWTAPLATSRLPDALFLIVVSGGAVPPHRTVSYEIETRMHAAGLDDDLIARALVLQRGVDDQMRGTRGPDAWDALRAARSEPWFGTAFGMAAGDVPETLDELPSDRADYRRVLDFDAVPILQALDRPLLFLFGGKDESVPPQESVAALRAAFDRGDEYAIEVYDDADHVLMTPSHAFADGALDRMVGWMLAHTSVETLVARLGRPAEGLHASRTLARIGPAAIPAVVVALGDDDPVMRLHAAMTLGSMGAEAAPSVPALVARIDDPVREVQALVVGALGEIGPAAAAARAPLETLAASGHRGAQKALARIRAP